jgi:hypothetical protein
MQWGTFEQWSDPSRISTDCFLYLFGITTTHQEGFVFGTWYQLGD